MTHELDHGDALDELLATLQSPASADELAAREPVVHAMAALVTRPAPIQEGRRMKRITPKAAGIAAAAFLSLTGVAAAATQGALPPPVQNTVSTLASPVVDIPRSDDHPAAESTEHRSDGRPEADDRSTTTAGDQATTPSAPPCPTDGQHHGVAVSETARSTDATGREHGAAVSAMARSDCGKPSKTPGTGPTTPPVGGVPGSHESDHTRGSQGPEHAPTPPGAGSSTDGEHHGESHDPGNDHAATPPTGGPAPTAPTHDRSSGDHGSGSISGSSGSVSGSPDHPGSGHRDNPATPTSAAESSGGHD
ncbi:MAG: hypothetical protein U0V73_12985 [Acidimicrobiia bacterium]